MPKPLTRIRLRPHGNAGRTKRPAGTPLLMSIWPRPGSKLANMLTLLMRPEGATIGELAYVTSWHEHSVRAALVSFNRRRMGLMVMSIKSPDLMRRYHVRKPGRPVPSKEPGDE